MTSRDVLRSLSMALGLLALLVAPLSAQVRHPGQPAPGLDGPIPRYEVAVPDVVALRAEDSLRKEQGIGPLRFGAYVPMALPFSDLARWQASADGSQLAARMELHGAGAFSLSVEFSRYELPKGGKFFVYNPGKSRVLGAYTAANRIESGEFVVQPLPGDTLILEYTQPIDTPVRPKIDIQGVTYDYADLFGMEGGLTPFAGEGGGAEGGCSIGANCPDGDPYPDQKRAAVRTIYQGALCSASTVNNTSNDGTPYLYTANHCGTGSTVVMYFNYQQTGCDSGPADSSQTKVGGTLLANDLDTDGRLLRINGSIPEAYQPFLAGWSRATANLQLGVGFHHPGGAPKNVAIDSNGGGQGTSNFAGIGPVKIWSMNFQVGGTAGGSSGSPIFDQNGRVRGTLTGGPAQCNVSLYGRFHSFWNESNIATWLDPLGTGQTNLDGFDVFGDLVPASISSVSPGSGPAGGFTPVTILGSGFDGTETVSFGGVAAADFVLVSDSRIDLLAPGGSLGATVDVSVTDSFGTDVQPNAFTYTANPRPSITAVTPNTGTIGGGLDVFITGPNVVGVTSVEFGGVASPSIEIIDTGSLRATSPTTTFVGAVDVVVFGNGSDSLVDGFSYVNPGEFIQFGVSDLPIFSGSGSTIPGDPAGFTLGVLIGQPGAPGVILVSLTESALPFKQSILYPFPILAQIPFAGGIFGATTIGPIVMPVDVPSATVLITQVGFAAPTSPGGVKMSNGLRIVVGED